MGLEKALNELQQLETKALTRGSYQDPETKNKCVIGILCPSVISVVPTFCWGRSITRLYCDFQEVREDLAKLELNLDEAEELQNYNDCWKVPDERRYQLMLTKIESMINESKEKTKTSQP